MASDIAKVLSSFSPDTSLAVNKRVVQLLEWAAKHAPERYLPLHLCVKAVMGYTHTPRLNNEEVDRLRKSLTSVRRMLEAEHNRELLHQTGIGIRATISSYDVLKNKMPQRARRLANAHAAALKTAERIDPKTLPATAEAAGWKKWLTKTVQPSLAAINAEATTQLSLPPGKE